jgi:hypothetical protein
MKWLRRLLLSTRPLFMGNCRFDHYDITVLLEYKGPHMRRKGTTFVHYLEGLWEGRYGEEGRATIIVKLDYRSNSLVFFATSELQVSVSML